MTRYYWILLIVGGLPLLIYPFILLANVMSLAATKTGKHVPPLQNLTSTAFLWSSTLYPIVYAVCALAAVSCARGGNPTMAFYLSIAALLHLGLCVLLFFGWMMSSP